MKSPEQRATDSRRPGRLGVFATIALALYLPACMGPGCFLDDSGIVSDLYRYDARATIQSADGTRSEVSTDNLLEFTGGAEAPIFAAPAEEYGVSWARADWLAYLRRVLEERSGDEAFRAVYGAGPWCVVGAPVLAASGEIIGWDDPRRADEDGLELDVCPCGEECGNPEGVVPALSVMPTSAAMPYHVNLGAVPVGGSSMEEVTLTNSGEGRLCLNPPSIHATSEHPDDFAVAPISGCEMTPEGLLVLEGDQACRFRVTFTPSQAGPRSALVPAARGCGDYVTLVGTGIGGDLTASPAPACFAAPMPPNPCEVAVRIDNGSTATVSLSSTAVSGSGGASRLVDTDGTTIDLTAGPYDLPPGGFVEARAQGCELATNGGTLRVTHNGSDYGAPGSPTGDVDPGSPLVVTLLASSSGCTP